MRAVEESAPLLPQGKGLVGFDRYCQDPLVGLFPSTRLQYSLRPTIICWPFGIDSALVTLPSLRSPSGLDTTMANLYCHVRFVWELLLFNLQLQVLAVFIALTCASKEAL